MKKIILASSLMLIVLICFSQNDIQILNAGTKDGIHDIEITHAGRIFIYTYGTGKIIRSSDKGESWEIVANLDSIYFEQIQFLDDKTGWICGEYGKIYYTNDGGENWQDRSIQIDTGNLLLYGMLFEENGKGIVAGAVLKERKLINTIYKTKDGGKSWSEVPHANIPSMILNLEKSKAGQIWGSGGNAIIKYVNDNWNIMFYDSTKATGQIRDLLFINDQTVIAVSFNGKIIRTVDGGQTWKITRITSNRLRALALLPDNSLITAGDQNKEKGHIFISNNAGVSWTVLEKELEDVHRIQTSGSSCWLVGKEGMICKMNFY